ncbi:HIT domain-containing protein [Rhodococcus sp. Eu-32]|uniref:HIT family protein n=1 Tax=Rhodococcus sp. Eu-32 TaxID=1017319 RepID=UPI000DF258C4|nr:HIT domain-containing protein [Rhodococcus sp. Eu-32]RRQ26284.1 HIT domain-containing protein [Rhodococcus sp. Eu-32]
MTNCPFCKRIDAYDYEESYNQFVVRFEPLNPVTPGHMLFVPTEHCEHRTSLGTEEIRAAVSYAHSYARHRDDDFNIITSSGSSATQTIPHIHVHYVPRRPDDGLALPWTPKVSLP